MRIPFRDLRPSGFRSTAALLLALLLGINALAIGTVVAARGRVKDAAARELQRRTERHAQALEAALAATRGDLLFLAQSGSLRHLLDAATDPDPYRRRWGRLDAEAAALLFLRSHPEIARLVAVDDAGTPLLAVGRRGGAPIALPPPAPSGRPPRVPVPPKGEVLPLVLEVDLAPDGLLGKLSAGDAAYVLRDRADAASPLASVTDGQLTAAIPVTDLAWHPPISWTLHSRESESDVLRSVEHFAIDFRNTVVLNVALVVLASLLGWMALREVRAVERLESERRNLDRLRELELGLMHRDRLAALGRIAAGIAHEINNPLEGMSNYLRLAEDDLAAGEPGAAKQHLEGVAHGLERVAGIVRQTLAQAGDGRGAKDCIDLVPLVARTIDFARDDPKARAIDLRIMSTDGAVPVNGNATTLGQLVLNLVLNACEAQPDGGEVVVTFGREHEGRVSLAVDDRGPGIGDDDLENVFEPFYSTKGSTGLGLFLCHTIAADHGGTLRALHRDGGGARFVLELPLANPGGPD
jgi:signal transduction histidine kinase